MRLDFRAIALVFLRSACCGLAKRNVIALRSLTSENIPHKYCTDQVTIIKLGLSSAAAPSTDCPASKLSLPARVADSAPARVADKVSVSKLIFCQAH